MKYTGSELAESFVFRSKLSPAQREESNRLLREARAKQKAKITSEDKLQAAIMQLRYQIEDYLKAGKYNQDYSFAYFLRNYIKLRYKINKDFAKDISLEETELSQILNEHRMPSPKIIVRIELHSSIPALYWYKLIEKQKEYELQTDMVLREKESRYVKNRTALKL